MTSNGNVSRRKLKVDRNSQTFIDARIVAWMWTKKASSEFDLPKGTDEKKKDEFIKVWWAVEKYFLSLPPQGFRSGTI